MSIPGLRTGPDQIRFGVSIYPQPPDWRHFLSLVQQMETAGFDGYFSYDHPGSNADCWTALSALAAVTSTIRLGLAVDCIYYRSPYLLARQAADVDRLSNGRLVLGLGIGHVKNEFHEMGIPFPSNRGTAGGHGGNDRHRARALLGRAVSLRGQAVVGRFPGNISAARATAARADPAGRRRGKSHARGRSRNMPTPPTWARTARLAWQSPMTDIRAQIPGAGGLLRGIRSPSRFGAAQPVHYAARPRAQ